MTAAWQLEARAARLAGGGRSGFVDLTRPGRGWQQLAINPVGQKREPLDAQLLCVDLPESAASALAESYVRGNDLIATYDQTTGRPARTQVYWRYLPPGDCSSLPEILGGVELVVSVQTSLLDSDPGLTTSSQLAARRAWYSPAAGAEFAPVDLPSAELSGPDDSITASPGGTLFELSDAFWYLEMVHPAEADRSTLKRESSGHYQLHHPLFAQRLEKGVILRARIRGLFLSGSSGAALFAAANDAHMAFAASEPLLTT